MLIPSWVKHRSIVWWKYKDGDRILCRISNVASEYVTMQILAGTPEQALFIQRGIGECVAIQYQDGILELARL